MSEVKYNWRGLDLDGWCYEYVEKPEWSSDNEGWDIARGEYRACGELNRAEGGTDFLEWIGEGPDPRNASYEVGSGEPIHVHPEMETAPMFNPYAVQDKGGAAPTESPGGDSHYRQGGVEPIDFIMGNNLVHWKGNAIEYIFRAGKKDDEAIDIRKAIWHCEQRLKQLEGDDNG